jgi:hypothetical protein
MNSSLLNVLASRHDVVRIADLYTSKGTAPQACPLIYENEFEQVGKIHFIECKEQALGWACGFEGLFSTVWRRNGGPLANFG